MAGLDPIVYIIDDDQAMVESLSWIIESIGLKVKTFIRPQEFLEEYDPQIHGCLLLDVRMPGMSGFDLHAHLVKQRINIPIIFVSGYADIPMSVKAIKGGAVEFLSKPFRDEDLLDAVRAALDRDRQQREQNEKMNDLRRRYDALTQREQQVMSFVVAGLMNKQIGEELGLAEVTVKVHRHTLMKRIGAKTLADLVRMARLLGLPHEGEWQTNDYYNGSDLLARLFRPS